MLLSGQQLISSTLVSKLGRRLNPVEYARVNGTLQRLERKDWALKVYRALCKFRANVVTEHAYTLYKWANDCAAARRVIGEQKKAARDAECHSQSAPRLKASEHPIFGNRGLLTEKTWRKHKDELIDILRGMRVAHDTKRRNEMVSKILRQWCRSLPIARLPRDVDIPVFFPQLAELLMLPVDQDVPEGLKYRLRTAPADTLPVSKWMEKTFISAAHNSMLASAPHMVAQSAIPDEPAPVLNRAAAVFRDSQAGNQIPGARRYAHYPMIIDDLAPDSAPAFDACTSANIQTLVSSCGLDPVMTTWQEMHALNARFVCKTCLSGSDAEVFDWWSAVNHLRFMHHNHAAECLRLSPAIENKVVGTSSPPCALELYRCYQCWIESARTRCFRTEEEITAHCVAAHKIASAAVFHHYAPYQEDFLKLVRLNLGEYIRDVHILKDVAPVAPSSRRKRGLSLKAIFGTGLAKMNLFAQSPR
ncbi:hypothetical protein AURDEDRAFT_165613 [Auricularia subglabra TFB-10046 SS5]|nr:hypothetical protein AURDEDRAFT_165613 [Auricularia subglabra TFB-10046 SS5]